METAGEGVFFPFSIGRILLGHVSLSGPSSSSCLFLDHRCLLVCCFVPLLFCVVFNRSGHLLSSFILTLIERWKLHLTPSNWSIHVLIFLDFSSSCFDLGVSCCKALGKVFGVRICHCLGVILHLWGSIYVHVVLIQDLGFTVLLLLQLGSLLSFFVVVLCLWCEGWASGWLCFYKQPRRWHLVHRLENYSTNAEHFEVSTTAMILKSTLFITACRWMNNDNIRWWHVRLLLPWLL